MEYHIIEQGRNEAGLVTHTVTRNGKVIGEGMSYYDAILFTAGYTGPDDTIIDDYIGGQTYEWPYEKFIEQARVVLDEMADSAE